MKMNFKFLKYRIAVTNCDHHGSVLVYKGVEKTKLGKYQYVDAPLMTITDSYTIEPSMYYVLKPVYKSHKGDLRSDYIEVILPGVEK